MSGRPRVSVAAPGRCSRGRSAALAGCLPSFRRRGGRDCPGLRVLSQVFGCPSTGQTRPPPREPDPLSASRAACPCGTPSRPRSARGLQWRGDDWDVPDGRATFVMWPCVRCPSLFASASVVIRRGSSPGPSANGRQTPSRSGSCLVGEAVRARSRLAVGLPTRSSRVSRHRAKYVRALTGRPPPDRLPV
jgi:hypothetical protein